MLVIDLVRHVPEAMQPKKIAITNGHANGDAGGPVIEESTAEA